MRLVVDRTGRMLLAVALLAPALVAGENLAKVYPATMSWSQQGLFPICSAEDVWS